jgi:hypothetical protein
MFVLDTMQGTFKRYGVLKPKSPRFSSEQKYLNGGDGGESLSQKSKNDDFPS